MDKELKAKWVDALRSGQFQQITHGYYRLNGYCCLGVLAAVVTGKRGAEIHDLQTSDGHIGNWIETKCGVRDPHFGELVRMNDGGQTFQEIADYIEAKL